MITDRFIIGFIQAYKDMNDGNSPSYRKIAEACKICTNAAYKRVLKLEKYGKLKRKNGKIMSIL